MSIGDNYNASKDQSESNLILETQQILLICDCKMIRLDTSSSEEN